MHKTDKDNIRIISAFWEIVKMIFKIFFNS